MKRFNILLIALLSLVSYHTSVMSAQPTPVKNAAKSVFTLTTFKADGSLLASSHGVFVGSNGEAISDLTPFIGAARAVVVDANGRELAVTRMIGVNTIYDVARFRVNGKTTAASVATTIAPVGSQAWLLPYSMKKTPEAIATTVKGSETFMEHYGFYIFDLNIPENTVSCPFVNAQGEVLGLLQLTTSGNDIHATSAHYVSQLQISALNITDATMSRIGIPVALSSKLDEAQLALIVTGGDSLRHAAAVSDFIEQFPNMPDGYLSRAQMEVAANQFAAADRDMATVIKLSEKKDEAHYNYGQLIYEKQLYLPDVTYTPWSLDKAMDEATQAYSLNPLPVYRHLQAQITFTQGNYQQARDMFLELTKTSMRSPEVFYEASRSEQMLHPQDTSYITLLDSAVLACDTINQVNPSPYILARAQAYEAAGKYRRAVNDYVVYGYLMRGSLNANFYYIREQCEVKAKLYQQALVDISTAIQMDQQNVLYYAEKANLLLRVNMPEQAIAIAEQCVGLDADYSDGYLVLGLAQIQTQQKAQGLQNLEKARQLGNEQAQPLIEKYR